MCAVVCDHALELVLAHETHDAFSHAHDGVLRIAARGERVWLVVRRDGDCWHRQASSLAQPVDHGVELGRFGGSHDLGAVRTQNDFRRAPIHEQVHRSRQHQGHDGTGAAADELADCDDETGKARHQYENFHVVHADDSSRCTNGPMTKNKKGEPPRMACIISAADRPHDAHPVRRSRLAQARPDRASRSSQS
jgi:hypothetical protein